MKQNHYVLAAANVSDQRFPCGILRDGESCRSKAQFRLTPQCAHTEADWPTGQACAAHLAIAVRIAASRCRGHMHGDRVTVRPF